jgi:2-polyprenyl-6-methoxyphenol hydroxylase-like FAD-dependent oxidoreductase
MADAAADYDLIVIGGGLAGTAAAVAAHRQGRSVVLVSARDRHPPDFRGEKLGEAQMRLFDRTGLGPAARAHATAFDGAWSYRFNRLAERSSEREYGSDYAALVNALRDAIPPALRHVTARVTALATGPDRQRVTLADGTELAGRLLVLATGLGDSLLRMAGIARRDISRQHSLSLGFDLARPAAGFPFASMVWSREAGDPRLCYLTLFPIGTTMRGNLFTYRPLDDAWIGGFRTDPARALRTAMPRLEAAVGRLDVAGKAVVRPIDLVEAVSPARDGLVLLGDAASVVCPTTGKGMAKALTDADVLVNTWLPRWLETPGMGIDKISAFYADPVKAALDRGAMRESLASRNISLGQSSYWRLRRLASVTRLHWRDRAAEPIPAMAIAS